MKLCSTVSHVTVVILLNLDSALAIRLSNYQNTNLRKEIMKKSVEKFFLNNNKAIPQEENTNTNRLARFPYR